MTAVLSQRLTPLVRYLAIFVAIVAISAIALIGGCVYDNSRDASFPDDAELRSSFARASAWILNNRAEILSEDNAMLWLFVREAGKVSADARLSELASEYQARMPDGSVWRYIFDASGREVIAGQSLFFPEYFPDYNRLFVYGSTCNATVREDPAVIALLNASACGSVLAGLRTPACRTHQLMGLRFIQNNHCEPDEATAQTVATVQRLIAAELKWDFRVEDAYIQKVLMLVESGRRQDVKAISLRKILDAQRADGGWDGVHVIIQLPRDRILCWVDGHSYPRILPRRPSNFHATAQALYLLALWRGNGGN